jgi:hypothetical protein
MLAWVTVAALATGTGGTVMHDWLHCMVLAAYVCCFCLIHESIVKALGRIQGIPSSSWRCVIHIQVLAFVLIVPGVPTLDYLPRYCPMMIVLR